MTKSRAGNAPSNPVASGRIFINTMMKAMRAVRVVNRPVFEPHVEPVHFEPAHERPALKPRNERAFTAPREHVRDGFVDKAVAEIMARQRVLESAVPPRRQRTLDGGASAEPPPAQRAVDKAAAELAVRQHVIDNELAARQRVIDNDVGAEAKAPQEALNREAPGQDAPDQTKAPTARRAKKTRLTMI